MALSLKIGKNGRHNAVIVTSIKTGESFIIHIGDSSPNTIHLIMKAMKDEFRFTLTHETKE